MCKLPMIKPIQEAKKKGQEVKDYSIENAFLMSQQRSCKKYCLYMDIKNTTMSFEVYAHFQQSFK